MSKKAKQSPRPLEISTHKDAIREWLDWNRQTLCDQWFRATRLPRPGCWPNTPVQSPAQRRTFVWDMDKVREAFEEMMGRPKIKVVPEHKYPEGTNTE